MPASKLAVFEREMLGNVGESSLERELNLDDFAAECSAVHRCVIKESVIVLVVRASLYKVGVEA